MNWGELIGQYGYAAVLGGAFLEGETVLFLAGFAAHRGYLQLGGVMALAAGAGFVADQFWFWLGRRHGPALLRRFPKLAARAGPLQARLDRHRVPLVLSLRFLYGLRFAGPVMIGAGPLPWTLFLVLDAIGAVVWAVLVGGAGYAFGEALSAWFADLRRHEGAVLLGILLLGLTGGWLLRRHRRATPEPLPPELSTERAAPPPQRPDGAGIPRRR